MSTFSVCTIGNLTIDDIILYDTGQMFLECCGGDALYAAIGARVWGASPMLICRVGKNYPQGELQKLPEFGIEACLLQTESNDIRNWALYEPGGARQFVNHLSSGSNEDLSIAGNEIDEQSLNADGFHVAPMPVGRQESVLQRIQSKGVVSWDPYIYSLSDPAARETCYQLLKIVDLFLPSQEEAAALYQSNDLMGAARSFADAGAKVVAIKMNARGSLVYIKATHSFYQVPAYPCAVIDPTGAGDAFCGGFLAGFLQTGDPVTAASYGTVSASYVIEHISALRTFCADFSTAPHRHEHVMRRIMKL